MRILVVGGGAVGSLLTAYLTRGGRDVTMVDPWFPHVEAARGGLRVEAVEEDFVLPVTALYPDELDDFGAADVVVIAVKSQDTRVAALLAREHLGPDTVVMSAQNGMNDVRVGAIIGPQRMVGSVVVLGAHLLDAGLARRTSPRDLGSLVFGNLDTAHTHDIEAIAALFAPLGGVRTTGDVWPERWSKLTLNTMSNALAGVTGLTTNALWSDDDLLTVLVALAHETAGLARAAGVAMTPVFGTVSHDLLEKATSLSGPAWAEAVERIKSISFFRQGKRANYASLLQDVQKGRRTEVDHLNGWVVAQGRRLGVPTPTHEEVIVALRPVERGLVAPSPAVAAGLVAAVATRYA